MQSKPLNMVILKEHKETVFVVFIYKESCFSHNHPSGSKFEALTE
jgi:hypothetical protein